MTKKNLFIGAHVSISGGFDQAIIRGETIGATCIQIFTKSNRQWHAKKINTEEALSFIEQQKKSSIRVVVAHASYLINLGSTTDSTVEKSISALIEELHRCQLLHIPYLVLHPGTLRYEDKQQSLIFIAEQINKVLEQINPLRVTLLLETMAGQGSTAGQTFEEIATIINHIHNKKHIGVCVDTCHIFAAGYTFDTEASYKKLWQQFDKLIGIEKIKVFHINDSKKDCNSHVDRHEDIGKGKIPISAFELLMKDLQFQDIPKILETPKEDEYEDDKRNLATLKKYSNS
jgi:deoxyribonuclease IV